MTQKEESEDLGVRVGDFKSKSEIKRIAALNASVLAQKYWKLKQHRDQLEQELSMWKSLAMKHEKRARNLASQVKNLKRGKDV